MRKPGRLLAAYTAFPSYSIGNQLAAYQQCQDRNIPAGPLGTFRQWQERGRTVRRGQKALWLCAPRTIVRQDDPKDHVDPQAEAVTARTVTVFRWSPRWFVIDQTDGAPFVTPELGTWDQARALTTLNVTIIPFALVNGNIQGYAQGRAIALNPLAALPHKTLFHELAHVLLHTDEEHTTDHDLLPLKEVEAEAVALVCCETIGLPGTDFARGYLQHWLDGNELPERTAQRILHTADTILRAGRNAAHNKGGKIRQGRKSTSLASPRKAVGGAPRHDGIQN